MSDRLKQAAKIRNNLVVDLTFVNIAKPISDVFSVNDAEDDAKEIKAAPRVLTFIGRKLEKCSRHKSVSKKVMMREQLGHNTIACR